MSMIRIALTLAAALLASGSPGSATAAEKQVSVVLVHGAFVDASGWKAVYDALSKDGYEVLIVQNPTLTLEGDVAATERAIAKAKHPVILVGHSYGGMVITEAGVNPKVRSLAYIAAFAPDAGESVATLSAAPAPPGEAKAPLLPPQDGFLLVDPAKFPMAFAADVDPVTTRFMAAAQVPWGLPAVQTAITKVAWKTKPARYLVTTKDSMIPPTAQRTMAKRIGAKTVEIDSSHAVMLSHPRDVVAFITAADTVSGVASVAGAAASPWAQDGVGNGYDSVPAGAYSVVAEVKAKRGKEAELRTATLPLIAQVRSDPKNLVYFLQEDREVPGHFIFFEIFANRADFEAHNAMPYVKAWLARLPELAEGGGVKVMRMEILAESTKAGSKN